MADQAKGSTPSPSDGRPTGPAAGASAAPEDAHREGRPAGGEGDRREFLSEGAGAQAADAAHTVKQRAWEIAEMRKDDLADRLGNFAKAVNSAADELALESATVGDMLRVAAGSIEQASGSLRDRPVNKLTETFTQLARERPVALFASAVVAGFACSRLLRSTATDRSQSSGH